MDSARPIIDIENQLALAEKRNTEYMAMIMAAPLGMTLLRGTDLVVEIANDPMLNIWNHSREEIIGRRLLDIFPELTDQAFPRLLSNVFHTGNALKIPEMEADIVSPHGNKHIYIDFSYNPLFDSEGKVTGIMASVIDITELVIGRKRLEENEQEQQALNEELTAINEELASSNEELISSQDNLEQHIISLAESEGRFRSLVSQAPVGICVIRAADLMILEVNNNYLELVGKNRAEMENLTIWQAISEVADNYAPIMNEVINSGKPFIGNENEVILVRHGMPERLFVDFVYEPVLDNFGKVSAIMVVAIDVTTKVLARHGIADVEERIRLAVEAAEIGTYEHDLLTDELIGSERYYQIFGFNHEVSRNELVVLIHPDDRDMAAILREEGYQTGNLFYEARFILPNSKIRWVRAQGKVYHDENGRPIRLLGTVLDITEFKRLQQQKDDFISIASHELKTPITSLKAALQILERLKETPESPLLPKLIDQSNRSMNKISELVEDLLNVSRMSEGEITLNKTTFTISKMLNDCCHHVRVSGKHELIFRGDEALEVFADEHRIDQVVVNFVNNAVKYAPESSKIYLMAEKREEMAWIAVQDAGSGIPTEKQHLLFDRYYRADESGMQVSGLGLGLYISAEIITRHKGKIGVHSEPGKGSTFWFTLPLRS